MTTNSQFDSYDYERRSDLSVRRHPRAQREVLVLKRQQDVAKDVPNSLIEFVKDAPAPGRIDTYA